MLEHHKTNLIEGRIALLFFAAFLIGLLIGCVSPTAPHYRCEAEKRETYRTLYNSEITTEYLQGDVWILSPISSVTFGSDCGVTRVN